MFPIEIKADDIIGSASTRFASSYHSAFSVSLRTGDLLLGQAIEWIEVPAEQMDS